MENRPHVVLVEDDAAVRTVVGDYLRAGGWRVTQYRDGRSAADALDIGLPDVLVIDRMLPEIGGDELCRRVRAVSDIPIIMLTALGAVEQRIAGLEHGADDYLPKPFSMKELQLRMQAQLRRHTPSGPAAPFAAGAFRIDPAHRRAWIGTNEIVLTTREYELLLYCVQRPGEILTRDDILGDVWGWSFGDASTVTVHARRLREKIEPEPRYPIYLRTEWGVGYRFTPNGTE
ncbi:response regulator transcription factor [Gordonia humi]|uniref:DNA-binding response OmpR family regulator n=1 Tax=Gordonia humi TaxID=686429 RepID=A0A840F006_9ACTN|nr:response regulator transcription factor [Gordonia humi]MBB4137201.1 DNA-binding response OmpR family regulator [Gordonia humi]